MRYPGHWAQFKAFRDLGLFETEAIKVGEMEIIPRDVFHTLLEPKIKKEETKDYGLIKVVCKGKNENVEVDLIDKYDEETEFTSMQRLTGWHASIIAILSAQNKISKGALPIHEAADGKLIVDEFEKRGIKIRVKKS
jgi:lysine 6-dehydrogenase